MTERPIKSTSTVRKFRIVRQEGKRSIEREIEHYNLDAILAVGYRVRSDRGVQFRRWATERLREYLVKGFTMDDQRLKNPPIEGSGTPDYFTEFLRFNERSILDNKGKVSKADADARAEGEHKAFTARRRALLETEAERAGQKELHARVFRALVKGSNK